MQLREDQLDARYLLLGVLVDGHAPAVVLYLQGAVFEQPDMDLARMPGDRLVDRIVDYLVGQMVGARCIGVHPGPPAHGLQPAQHLYIGGAVVLSHTVRSFNAARRPRTSGSNEDFESLETARNCTV